MSKTGLTAEQVAEFQREGFLVVRNYLDPREDLDPIIREYEGVLNTLAEELHARGEIKSTHADKDFSERLIHVCQESGKVQAQYFDFSLPQKNIQADTPIWNGPAVFNALRNPRILDAIESLIGPEIYSNPVQHVRLKLPEKRGVQDEVGQLVQGATPWHQDNGVVLPEADETDMITVWFSLWDAPVESGCLKLVPRSHRDGLVTHCPLGPAGAGIPEKLIKQEEAIPVPMRRGDVLFLHRRTCHGSLSNESNRVRWSFDLRYNPIGQDTGRKSFPGFVARSRAHPESELHDPVQWAESWREARRKLSQAGEPFFNRWSDKAEVCA
ncbi:MAG: phytanoyl-CoA dioxygenase family protein [Cephaloticoccus sp.]|nr:phytanoyl-CoA dioxygenase family protein [Cephaloticoccus sp.]